MGTPLSEADSVKRAAQFQRRQIAEAGKVRRAHRQAAVQLRLADPAGEADIGGRRVQLRDAEIGDAFIDRAVGGERERIAERACQRRVAQGNAARLRADGEGDRRGVRFRARRRRGRETGQKRFRRSLRHDHVCGVELGLDARTHDRPGDGGIEGELADFRLARRGLVAGIGAGLRRDLQVGDLVRRQRALHVKPRRLRLDGDGLDGDGAAVGEIDIAVELRGAGKHRRRRRRQQALDARHEIEGQVARIGGAPHMRAAIGADVAAGIESQLRVEGIERAGAIEVELHRRLARHIQRVRHDAAGRLIAASFSVKRWSSAPA